MTEVLILVKIPRFYIGIEAEPPDPRELSGMGSGHHSVSHCEPMT